MWPFNKRNKDKKNNISVSDIEIYSGAIIDRCVYQDMYVDITDAADELGITENLDDYTIGVVVHDMLIED